MESSFPDDLSRIAAHVRQLRRANEAGDEIAAWLTTNALCSSLRYLLSELLTQEPSWDSKGRWLDALFQREVFFEPLQRVRVTGPMTWGMRGNEAGPQWAEPFETVLHFTPSFQDLDAYTIRFGEREKPESEGSRESIARIIRALAEGTVQWSFELTLPPRPA